MAHRLPTPGGDDGTWGDILNDFLTQAHNGDGTVKNDVISDININSGAGISKSKLSSGVQASLTSADNSVQASQLGSASGVATLNSSSKLNDSQLPASALTSSSLFNLLKYAPPTQSNPTVVNVPAGGGTFGSTGSPYGSSADLTFVLPTGVPMTGTLRWYGGRHVRIIGGICQPSSGVGNYVIVGQQVSGSVFIEGVEFPDQSAANPDVISVCGDWSGSTNGFAPDVYIQNCRCLKIRATNSTNHADFFQPQGVINHLYIDKLTVSTNYDVFTIASDSCNNVAPLGVFFNRINTWWDAANGTNPFTAHYWINSATGSSGGDTQPFPIVFNDVFCDKTRGAGRVETAASAIYPHTTQTAGGGTYANISTTSVFSSGETIGAQNSTDGTYAYISDPKMMCDGVVYDYSPPVSRGDVFTDTDSLGSFVPAGIGTNYISPGYIQTPGVDYAN